MPSTVQPTQQQRAIDLLKGQKILLPDFHNLLAGWEWNTYNESFAKVKEDVDAWTEKYALDARIQRRIQRGNFGLLATSAWKSGTSGSDEHNLSTLAKYCAWTFAWDDYFDEGLSRPEALKALQAETVRHVNNVLGDDEDEEEEEEEEEEEGVNPINVGFSEVAERVRAVCSAGTRRRLLHSMLDYILSVTELANPDGSMPAVNEYLGQRYLSSGLEPALALMEFVYGVRDIPDEIMDGEDMEVVRRRTVEISMLLNDLVSSRNEVTTNQTSNIVCVLAHAHSLSTSTSPGTTNSAQAAADAATLIIKSAYKSFNLASAQLLRRNPAHEKELTKMVDGCKIFCTGYLNWAFKSGRYFGKNPVFEDGRIVLEF